MRLCVHRMKLLALSIGSVVSSVARGLGDEPVPRGRHLDRFPPSVRRSLRPLQTKLDGTLGALSRGHHLRDGRVVGGGLIRAQVH